jgi:hypothetical protein
VNCHHYEEVQRKQEQNLQRVSTEKNKNSREKRLANAMQKMKRVNCYLTMFDYVI